MFTFQTNTKQDWYVKRMTQIRYLDRSPEKCRARSLYVYTTLTWIITKPRTAILVPCAPRASARVNLNHSSENNSCVLEKKRRNSRQPITSFDQHIHWTKESSSSSFIAIAVYRYATATTISLSNDSAAGSIDNYLSTHTHVRLSLKMKMESETDGIEQLTSDVFPRV